MRWTIALVALVLAGCAGGHSGQVSQAEQQEIIRRYYASNGRGCPQGDCSRLQAEAEAARAAADRSLTPAQRALRDFDVAGRARENELLLRALSLSPDYTAAVRRAAIANVDAVAALPPELGLRRRPAQSPRAREAAITAEEARLSDAVEVRRRQRLMVQAQQMQGQQDQQAAANCISLGQQIEASMYRSRSLLNLEATASGAQAREQCWANYQASRAR